jgi:hypothetical protein
MCAYIRFDSVWSFILLITKVSLESRVNLKYNIYTEATERGPKDRIRPHFIRKLMFPFLAYNPTFSSSHSVDRNVSSVDHMINFAIDHRFGLVYDGDHSSRGNSSY